MLAREDLLPLGSLVRSVGEGHPDGAPEARRLDHEPILPCPAGKGLELAEDRFGRRPPARCRHLAPVDDGQAEAAPDPLLQRLVHADGRPEDPRARVGQAGRLEEGLDRAILPERPVERDEHDRCRSFGSEPVEGRPHGMRSIGPEAHRLVVGCRGATVPAMVRGQPPPGSVEVDEHLVDGHPVRPQRVGDGRPGDDRDVVLGRRSAEEDDDGRRGG